MKIESKELIQTLKSWQNESTYTGLKESALLQKVIEEVQRMATNEEIKERIEQERRTSCKPKQVDKGKIGALYKAGWPVTKIADELDVTHQTVRYHLRKMGLQTEQEGREDGCMKRRLRNLRKLIKESEHLAELISRPAAYKDYVADTAKDYRSGYPHNILIAGLGDDKYPELRQQYYDKLCRIQSEIAIIEKWLDDVPDPETRDILRLHYVNGLTQEQIADELGYARETVSRKLKKFWDVTSSH